MRFDWVGRLAIGLAIMTPLAALFSCDLIPFNPGAWCPAPPQPVAIGGFLSPAQIIPPWYLWPLFGAVRSITFNVGAIEARTLGMFAACAVFIAPLTLAFFNWSKTPARAWLTLLVIPPVLIGLGWLGVQPYDGRFSNVGLWLTVIYLAVFWIVFPLFARRTDQVMT